MNPRTPAIFDRFRADPLWAELQRIKPGRWLPVMIGNHFCPAQEITLEYGVRDAVLNPSAKYRTYEHDGTRLLTVETANTLRPPLSLGEEVSVRWRCDALPASDLNPVIEGVFKVAAVHEEESTLCRIVLFGDSAITRRVP